MNAVINSALVVVLRLLLRFYPAPLPQVFRGDGAIEELAERAVADGPKGVLLVTTEGMVRRGKIDSVVAVFERAGAAARVFTDVPPNPSLDVVERGAEECQSHGCGAVFAYGGGSVIDAAKGIAARVGAGVPARKLVGLFKLRRAALPLYVVPSTAGSGSEASNAAVLSDPQTHQKLFLLDHKVVPRAVALDPAATLALPPAMTAATGMDAMTHAIESYVSTVSDATAEELAVSAIGAIFENLPKAHAHGDDAAAREAMAIAAYEAGVAFTRSGLGFVHAISHQLTAFYGVPHGVANAVILPHVLRFSAPRAARPLARLASVAGVGEDGQDDAQRAAAFIERVRDLTAALGLPAGFPEMREEDFDAIAKNAIREATRSFPVPRMMTPDDCRAVLRLLKEERF